MNPLLPLTIVGLLGAAWYTYDKVPGLSSDDTPIIPKNASRKYQYTTGRGGVDDCGKREKGFRGAIVNGVVVEEKEIPWIAMITRKHLGSREQFCGGSIIADRWIMTAAHCFFDPEEPHDPTFDANSWEIGVGAVVMEKATFYRIEKHFVHEKFDNRKMDFINDIALLKTKVPIAFKTAKQNKYIVNKFCLPKQGETKPNDTGIVAGWGQVGEEDWASDNLLKAEVAVQDLESCRKNYTDPNIAGEAVVDVFPPGAFCASKPVEGKDSCQGDSGGPWFQYDLQSRATVRGIVSFGIGCARAELPGVYTNVALYLDWINDKIKHQ